jgi:two-component system sensor histidine kinase TctE
VAERERFTADAAHELRTPLAVLRAGLEVALSRERSGTEYRSALEDALAGTDRLCRLAEDLLALARIDAGAESGAPSSVVLEEMLQELGDAWLPACSRRGIRMQVDAPRELSVRGNAGALYRLFNNLIDNAVAHSPQGGRVVLSAEGAPPWAHVTIADEGPGIRAEEASRVFDRFYRGAAGSERSGSGLGLSIARKIAAAHAGRIALVDGRGGGCVLRVTLPLETLHR